jgi:hypothetical protein
MKQWRQSTDKMPPGVARAWHAVEGAMSFVGIFEVIAGGTFLLVYHEMGQKEVTTERFPSFIMAQEHANAIMSTRKLMPRTFV